MHELWHFYTWYGIGVDEEVKLGKKRYNDCKEALTVLLNEACADLLPEGVVDEGYQQHQVMREQAVRRWKECHDVVKIWQHLAQQNLTK